MCWQYTFPIPEDFEFIQEEGTIYWLNVQAFPLDDTAHFGWKTSVFHFNDDAVYAEGDDFAHGPWMELRYPPEHPYYPQSIDLAFMLLGEEIDRPARPDPWPFVEYGDTCMADSDCWGAAETVAYCVPEEGGSYPGVCYAPTNRYISIARDAAQVANTARRISLSTDLAGPWWVGPPTYNPAENMYFASVSPTPVYAGIDFAGDWPDVIHVKGCEIAPGVHTYLVQAIALGSDESEESNYSEALELRVCMRWGDVVSTCYYNHCLPPTGAFTEPSIDDVLAEVNAFTGIRNAPLPWMDIDPVYANGEPEGMWTLIGDVLAVVNAFSGAPYSGWGPLGCP
jgi:hypothetical protein